MDIEKLLKGLKENLESVIRSLEGKRVVKYIKPASETGIRYCLLFENETILEIGIPVDIESARVDYERGAETIDSFDIYTIDELRERLKEEKNPHRISYYQQILELYEK